MWFIYESLTHRNDLESRKGDKYSAYVLEATKKVYKGDDEPYSKIIFENTFVKIIDRKGETEMVVNEFFDMCQPGDLIDMKSEKNGDFWNIVSLENKTRSVLPEGAGTIPQDMTSMGSAPSGWDAAVNFVNVLVNNGHYKDKTSPEILLDAVVTYRMRLDALDSVALDSSIEEHDEAA